MLRRIVAVIFVLGIVGQAWAAACVCDDAKLVHSCCKRKVEKNNCFSAKGCCDDEGCIQQRTPTPSASLSQPVVTRTPVAAQPVDVLHYTFTAPVDYEPVRPTATAGRSRHLARPPDLYVRHHAFRI
ncbi:MAG TPA: hypothetical protein VL501_06675 [Pyrinomonadaceae bacterium]|nr:hypothetical protein [Pyrinomonadaceae bacterium]